MSSERTLDAFAWWTIPSIGLDIRQRFTTCEQTVPLPRTRVRSS